MNCVNFLFIQSKTSLLTLDHSVWSQYATSIFLKLKDLYYFDLFTLLFTFKKIIFRNYVKSQDDIGMK